MSFKFDTFFKNVFHFWVTFLTNTKVNVLDL